MKDKEKVIDALLIDRLVSAREMLAAASMRSSEPGLGPAQGISQAQDAIELILRAIAEFRQVRLSNVAGFEEILREVGKTIVDGSAMVIPHHQRLLELNKTRINFKHYGIRPDASQARAMVKFASKAAEDLCMDCLGVALWDISSVRMIKKTRVRNYLSAAITLRDEGRFEDSCVRSGIAFALTFGEVQSRRFARDGEIAGRVKGFRLWNSGSDRPVSTRDFGEFVDAAKSDAAGIAEQLAKIQRQIDLLKLGVNLDALRRFEELLPSIRIWQNGGIFVDGFATGDQFDRDDADFALQFAIDSIVKGQSDFSTPVRSIGTVEVLEDTPILARFRSPGSRDAIEQIAIATVGDKYSLMRDQNLGGELVEIAFEGDRCYIAQSRIKIIKPEGNPLG